MHARDDVGEALLFCNFNGTFMGSKSQGKVHMLPVGHTLPRSDLEAMKL